LFRGQSLRAKQPKQIFVPTPRGMPAGARGEIAARLHYRTEIAVIAVVQGQHQRAVILSEVGDPPRAHVLNLKEELRRATDSVAQLGSERHSIQLSQS